MNPKALFISGTDTGVGKTWFAAALALTLVRLGLKVGVMKPIESGVVDVDTLGDDATLLAWAAQSDQPAQLISPYRLHNAVAPSVAASHEQIKIIPSVIQEAFETLNRNHDFLIVEGAGGLMTPLAGGFLVADLIQLLQLQTLFVCRPGLGTINHTLLTLFTARQLGLKTAGYVINGMPESPNMAEEKAPHTLASLMADELLGVTPFVKGADPHSTVEQLAAAITVMPTWNKLSALIGLGHLKDS